MNGFEFPEMSNLLRIAVKGAALLVVTGLAASALHRASAATRHGVWFLGMAGLLLLPIAALVTPSWVVEVPDGVMSLLPDAVRERVQAPLRLFGGATDEASAALPPSSPARVNSFDAPLSDDGAGVARALFANTTIRQALALVFWLWLGGAVVLFLIFLTGLAALARLTRRSPPFLDGRINALTRELSLAMGIRGDVPVLRGRAGAMPMSWGLVRRVILLPEGAERWDDFHLQAVLRHELAHVRRRDCLTQAVAEVSLALHWLNPLAWLAARRLRVEREHACDDAVLLGGARPSDYALALIDMAASARPSPMRLRVASTMIRPVQLHDRLRAVLDEGRARRSSRLGAASAALLAAVLVSAVAAVTPAADTGAEMQATSPSEESNSAPADVSVDASQDARAVAQAVVESDVSAKQLARVVSPVIEEGDGALPIVVDAGLETDFALTPVASLPERSVPGEQPIIYIYIDSVNVSPLPGTNVLDSIPRDRIERIEVTRGRAAINLFGTQVADAEDPVTIHVKNNNFSDATLWLVSRGGRAHLGTVTGKTETSFTTPMTSPADVWRVEIDLVGGEWCQTKSLTVDPGDVLDLLVAVDVSNMPECYPAGSRPGD